MSKKYINDNDSDSGDINVNDIDIDLRVEHVKEVELGVDRDRGLQPGIVGRGPFFYDKLLKIMLSTFSSEISSVMSLQSGE